MAQAPHRAGEGANFVQHIVSDPKNVPDVMLLYGYLGASSEEGHERLYLSPDLSNFVEVPRASILHRAESSKEHDPHGGATLWVKKDAALKYKQAPAQQAAQQALAHYFAGAIQGAAQGGVAGVQARPHVTVGMCGRTQDCTLRCATEITPCVNTHAVTCFCPVTHGCPTQGPVCETAGDCTYIGCGQSLACTFGLLCGAAAAPAGPQAMTIAQPCPQTVVEAGCHLTQRTPCPGVSCGVDCTLEPPCPTHVATCAATCHATCAPGVTCGVDCTLLCTRLTPCQTHVATCAVTCHATCAPACPTHPPHATCVPNCTLVAPCPTHVATCPPHATCAPICTHVTPCVTRGGPDCPFPSEIPAQCTHLPNCHPPAAMAAMGGAVGAPVSAAGCSVGCGTVNTCAAGCGGITAYATCDPGCWASFDATCYPDCRVTLDVTCGYDCWVTRYATCQPACYVTRYATCHVTCNPGLCWVTRACPVQTAACPIQSAACPV